MSLFEQAVKAYFGEKLGREVTSVTFDYNEGYRYSSYTYEDPSFRIRVYGADDELLGWYDNQTAGEFLTELFAWEAKS